MMNYVLLVAFVMGLPILYWGLLQWYKPNFEQKVNQNRKPLRSFPEMFVMTASEIALIKIWYEYTNRNLSGLMLTLLYTVLVTMMVLCMTDYWEKLVPNRILLLMLLICVIEICVQGLRDIQVLLLMLPSIVLGLIFCMLSFGVGYLLSHGSMGSGDVKLAILLGIFLTADYVIGTVFYGCLISAGYSIVQMCRKRLTRKDQIPFVPFLYLGLIITYLVG